MTGPCADFRARLERELLGRPSHDQMRALEWHEHLLGCTACRELLEAEQALEELLASLPEPRLSADVRERLLARLRARREADEAALDALLDLDGENAPTAAPAAAPDGLAAGVLSGLAAHRASRGADPAAGLDERRERELDRLLERDTVAAPPGLAGRVLAAVAPERRTADVALDALLERDRVDVPAGLAARVRAGLARELVPPAREAAPRRLPRFTRRLAALAAGLLVALALWARYAAPRDEDLGPRDEELAQVEDDFPELDEILAELDVLVDYDTLVEAGANIDLLEIEPEDEVLLSFADAVELEDLDASGEAR